LPVISYYSYVIGYICYIEVFVFDYHQFDTVNIHQLERQGVDIQSKVEELEQPNQSMRDRDKIKHDAIEHLSEQLVV